MSKDKRNFIIFNNHRRLKRLWQFFFTSWGILMIAALVAGTLFTRQLLWTPLSAINMREIEGNQFKMSNASFAGIDKNGQPFTLLAKIARQEYEKPNMIFTETVSGTTVRILDGKKIRDKIRAKSGVYNRDNKTITFRGNVNVDSDNGDRVLTDELLIQL